MTRYHKTVALVGIGAVLVLTLAFIGRDLWLRRGTVNCGDSRHPRIDIRDFTTRYSAYSIELEASVGDKGKIATKFTPQQLQQLSDTFQSAREFRQYVVAGYDACAITQDQYGQLGAKFQALDGLAREINTYTAKPSLSQKEEADLSSLISRYSELVGKLPTQ